MKHILYIISFCLLCTCSFDALGQDNSDLIVIRLYESTSASNFIAVSDHESLLYNVDLKKSLGKNMIENQVAFTKEVKKYLDQGYNIESGVAADNGAHSVSTYILKK